jgi:ferredoxin
MKNYLAPLVKTSTLEFLREARHTPGFSWFDALHGLVYARWPYLYIGIGTGEHPLARRFGPSVDRVVKRLSRRNGRAEQNPTNEDADLPPEQVKVSHTFADSYHGKVVPLESARQLVLVQEDVRLPDLEKIIPYQRARDLILTNPDHIAVLDCPCRVSRADPCLPLDVCLIIGEPFASYIIEHQPKRARWISQQEAAGILEAEHARGHVHHAFFKDAMLGRFYAICNCCACCCGALQAQRRGTPMLVSSGYIAQVDENLCIGCGTCSEYCQFQALEVVDFHSRVDFARCMGCGVCVSQCTQGAINLVRALEKGEPLEIFALMAEAEEVV